MQTYKQELITFLIKTGALSVFDSPENDRSLKSKRLSPWFVNMGEFNDGESTSVLGNVYAGAIADSEINFDSLYGIPEKGVALAIATSIGLISRGVNAPWFFTRKDEKTQEVKSVGILNFKKRAKGINEIIEFKLPIKIEMSLI